MQSDNRTISVLVDNDSWILPFADTLVATLQRQGHEARLIRHAGELQSGWANFMLGCTQLLKSDKLHLNQHNLVVHESALPRGRGFAPVAWQILEGANTIPVTLFEATEGADDGPIWLTGSIELQGHELLPQWREQQGRVTVDLCLRFVRDYPKLQPRAQIGKPSRYPRRRPADSELDVRRPLADQFGLLRVVDNERYPAFFVLDGRRYRLRIDPWEDEV